MKYHITFLGALILSTIAYGQNAVTFMVSDESGIPLTGATVVIEGTTKGTVTNTVFSLVEGELKVRVENKTVSVTTPGECFGELSLLHNIPRTADVIVSSEHAVVLCLSETNLQRLISSEAARNLLCRRGGEKGVDVVFFPSWSLPVDSIFSVTRFRTSSPRLARRGVAPSGF